MFYPKAIIASALIAAASTAQACDSLVLHITSFHSDRELIAEVNEQNPGLGCRIGDYEAGGYKNSFGDFTAYAVRDWTHESGLGVFAGVATGYQADLSVPEHGITPIGGAVYRGDYATIRAMPSYNKSSGAKGIVLSLSLNIGETQ